MSETLPLLYQEHAQEQSEHHSLVKDQEIFNNRKWSVKESKEKQWIVMKPVSSSKTFKAMRFNVHLRFLKIDKSN